MKALALGAYDLQDSVTDVTAAVVRVSEDLVALLTQARATMQLLQEQYPGRYPELSLWHYDIEFLCGAPKHTPVLETVADGGAAFELLPEYPSGLDAYAAEVDAPRLVVTRDDVYWTALWKHTNVVIETHRLELKNLLGETYAPS